MPTEGGGGSIYPGQCSQVRRSGLIIELTSSDLNNKDTESNFTTGVNFGWEWIPSISNLPLPNTTCPVHRGQQHSRSQQYHSETHFKGQNRKRYFLGILWFVCAKKSAIYFSGNKGAYERTRKRRVRAAIDPVQDAKVRWARLRRSHDDGRVTPKDRSTFSHAA